MTGTMAPEVSAESRGLTWQKLLLGDWSRIVRDPLDVYRILFVGGAIVWGLSGRPVTLLVAASAVLLLARLVDLPRFYDFSLIVVMVLDRVGRGARASTTRGSSTTTSSISPSRCSSRGWSTSCWSVSVSFPS